MRVLSLIFLTGLIVFANDCIGRELDPDDTGYYLKPQSAEVIIGKSVSLNLVFCTAWKNASDGESKQEGDAPPTLECGGSVIPFKPGTVTWKLEGKGSVSGDKEGATYQAPASMPTPNKAIVKATLTYDSPELKKQKHILLSEITIVDADYIGTFSSHEVSVNSEYTTDLSGNVRWVFEEDYDIGGWREYKGIGTAALTIKRLGCEAGAFSDVPVEGWLKLYKDNKYEFQINLVDEDELMLTRTCRRPDLDKDLTWEETYSSSGDGMSSSDHCGEKEFYPHYDDVKDLSYGRNGSCGNISPINQYQDGWSFKAVK